MSTRDLCHRHQSEPAVFVCDGCGKPFCGQCRCELLDGSIRCAECAVESAGQSGGVIHRPAADGNSDTGAAAKSKRFGRLLTVVLFICIPLLALEGYFLLRSRPEVAGTEAEARRVMSDTLVLITVLNHYHAENGVYPGELDQLVPAYWGGGDRAELLGYDYRRMGTERFILQPRLTGDKNQDQGIVRAKALIPPSIGPESDLQVFLQPAEGKP